MNLRTTIILILLLIWGALSWYWYTCKIKGFCCDTESVVLEEEVEIITPELFPITFNVNSDSAILTNFDKYRDSICAAYKDKYVQITGKYAEEEKGGDTTFINIGLSRAHKLKALLASCIDTSKVTITSYEWWKLNKPDLSAPFIATEIKEGDSIKIKDITEVKVVTHDGVSDVYFPYNSTKHISNAAFDKTLDEYAEALKADATKKIVLNGHTDNIGNDAYNNKLSVDRCNAIAKQLLARGVDKNAIEINGFGASKPKVPNTSDENRAINRRVEIKLTN